MSAKSWPSSPLEAAQRAFSLLLTPPTVFIYDTSGIEGLACGPIPLDRLRTLLLSARTTARQRDEVWRHLVDRARRDGPGWVVAAAGVAMPGLRRAAGRLSAGWPGDARDLDAELLAGFVAALRTLDLDGPRICGRLIEAGVRAARKARDTSAEQLARTAGIPGPALPERPADHPDFVLARAVAAGVVDADEARLIGATRLEGATLAQAGDEDRHAIDVEHRGPATRADRACRRGPQQRRQFVVGAGRERSRHVVVAPMPGDDHRAIMAGAG